MRLSTAYMSVSRFLHVQVLDDVTVKVYQTEEVETEWRRKSAQHPVNNTVLIPPILSTD